MIDRVEGQDRIRFNNATSFFSEQGYRQLTILTDPDVHFAKFLNPGGYPRFHCHIPYDPDRGVNI